MFGAVILDPHVIFSYFRRFNFDELSETFFLTFGDWLKKQISLVSAGTFTAHGNYLMIWQSDKEIGYLGYEQLLNLSRDNLHFHHYSLVGLGVVGAGENHKPICLGFHLLRKLCLMQLNPSLLFEHVRIDWHSKHNQRISWCWLIGRL